VNTTVESLVTLIGWLRYFWMPSFAVEIGSLQNQRESGEKYRLLHGIDAGGSLTRDFERDNQSAGRMIT
jgi:hypothetical protein